MASKRHHYVPEFYLRYFVKNPPTFWVYDKAAPDSPKQLTPINTAVEGHFYSLSTPSGKDDSIEKSLSALETSTKPILDRLQDSRAVPTAEERHLLAQFLALAYTRVPRTIAAVTEAYPQTGYEFAKYGADHPELIARFLDEERRLHKRDVPGLDEFVEVLRNAEKHFRIEIARDASLTESLSLVSVPKPRNSL